MGVAETGRGPGDWQLGEMKTEQEGCRMGGLWRTSQQVEGGGGLVDQPNDEKSSKMHSYAHHSKRGFQKRLRKKHKGALF